MRWIIAHAYSPAAQLDVRRDRPGVRADAGQAAACARSAAGHHVEAAGTATGHGREAPGTTTRGHDQAARGARYGDTSTATPGAAAPARRPAQPAARSGMAITVTDPTGATLSQVSVSVVGATERAGETNDSGQLNFPGLHGRYLPPPLLGESVMTFEREVTLRAGQVADLDIIAQPGGAAEGRHRRCAGHTDTGGARRVRHGPGRHAAGIVALRHGREGTGRESAAARVARRVQREPRSTIGAAHHSGSAAAALRERRSVVLRARRAGEHPRWRQDNNLSADGFVSVPRGTAFTSHAAGAAPARCLLACSAASPAKKRASRRRADASGHDKHPTGVIVTCGSADAPTGWPMPPSARRCAAVNARPTSARRRRRSTPTARRRSMPPSPPARFRSHRLLGGVVRALPHGRAGARRACAERAAGRYLVLKVDTEVQQDIAARFRIQSIPTLAVVVRSGRRSGAVPAPGRRRRSTSFVEQTLAAHPRRAS